ncbi:rubrerythrin-like domain-containing protein [Halomarina salina]|uniref:Rubrerythrin-like domain-containing protein n=1 Tax=Halomarina salina TaxID=1872699 RepID=A0ABD5RSR4_9EURY|nr:rubrerythrin-like domain-containing protein [Halomarina salina]
MSLNTVDPYTPEEAVFECLACQNRIVSEEYVGPCPECGGETKNIAVARE